jgi:hypothetical protein
MASEKECMDHASECVRLAGLTDDIAVRDQLVERLKAGYRLHSKSGALRK